MAELAAAIRDAHARHDLRDLARLYEQAADAAESVDAECFLLTYAYIYALDAGDERAPALHERLRAHGRET